MPATPFLLPRTVIEQSGVEIQDGSPVSALSPETEYVPLYLYDTNAFTTLPGELTASVPFTPFFLTEGETRAEAVALGLLPDYSDPSTYMVLPDGYTITDSTVLFYVNIETGLWGDMQQLEPADQPVIAVSVTASSGTHDITFERLVPGYVLQHDPVPTPGTHVVDLTLGHAALTIPYTDLVEPAEPSTEWLVSRLSISGPDIAGVTYGPTGVTFDPNVLGEQTDTPLTVTFGYEAMHEGQTYAAQASKDISLSVTTNVVALVAPITLDTGAIYVDQPTAAQFNFSTLTNPANVTGAINPVVIVRHQFDFTGTNPSVTVPDTPGQECIIFVDVYEDSIDPANLILSEQLSTTVQALFTVTETGDASTGVTWSYDVADAPAGPPDSYDVETLTIDGRAPKADLTVGELRAAATELVCTHPPIAGLPPIVAGPVGVSVTLTSEPVGDGLRYTISAPGLADLVVDA